MDATKELTEAKQRQQELVAESNRLRQQFQQEDQARLHEILRLDGEIRLLQRLSDNHDKAPDG